ncbi:6,7-dimethyl-8-ribityllumazine synthase [Cardiobacterium valvarum]|uniref:6,7-dimethyl-8-ribityllumazine synthase n=1 Tax=Cardiobacterium valvarum F0432 TaxID=797473 RepID=G9ZCK2_9GAMM|nr:6,7-dimethyl-8-ribityllumazine synthase [Cardiobacterium valvarum]EHM55733.1 6,7-dimethyl-8-ribityllumazine synthase [Cardiobacterium valvarum F0432]
MTSNDVNRLEGDYILDSARYAIICSRFNDFIVNKLEAGAIDALKRHGTELTNIDVAYVPGALELGIAAQRLAATSRYDAIIALGAVIKGATAHFDIVIGESAKALSSVALKHDIPVINGVLTTNNIEQAVERAGTKAGNKGAEAALVAIEMVSLLRQIG